MKRGLAIGLMVAIAVVVGVGMFFAGRSTGGGTPSPAEAMKVIQNLSQEQRAQLFQNGGGLFGNRTTGTGGQVNGSLTGGGLTAGSIIAKDSSSITVKDSSGNTKIVYFSSSTTISKNQDVTADALTVGEDVTVTGTSNTDGSVTATRIMMGTQAFGPGQNGAPGTPGGAQGGNGTTTASGQAPSGQPPTGSDSSAASPPASTSGN